MMIDYDGLMKRNTQQSHLYAAGLTKYALLESNEAIETLRAELTQAKADNRGVCTDCEDTGVTIQTERLCVCASGQAERLGRELAATKARLAEAVEENERLRKLAKPEWFYAPDSYESDCCQDSPEEVIDYAALFPGKHVFEVNCATSLPSIWCTVHVRTDKEMEALDTDDRTVITQFATEAEAAAFITK
jgi:hypothetical protein